MTTNHRAITGPKARPIRAVPSGWTANRSDQYDDRSRQHIGLKAGVAMLSPSSAESTEIAGVIVPSP